MTRTSTFILGIAAAIAFPTAAAAQCGSLQGSFMVTCEQGVQVYRHQALSGIPAPMSHAQASLKSEQIRAKTARQRIAAESRSDARNADLREREIAIQDYRARVYNSRSRRNTYYVSSYGNRGFGFARPASFREISRRSKH